MLRPTGLLSDVLLFYLVPGYELPWEVNDWTYPPNFASPCEIAIEASNGASDYGNKFGEPVLAGFSRSFGMLLENKERREWIKPIMFSGGIGSIDYRHICKRSPEAGSSSLIVGGQPQSTSNVFLTINASQ